MRNDNLAKTNARIFFKKEHFGFKLRRSTQKLNTFLNDSCGNIERIHS